MTEEEKATAPTAEKGPKDCKTCHSAGHIGPVCADCIESAYRHYTPEAPEGDGAEEGEELAALLITLDDAVGDLEADGNPEYAEAIKQARHILTVLTQPKEPEAEASREALIDRIADLERALQAERGAYDDLAAFTASLPAPADEKALREALEEIARPGVGLANIFADHPEETIDKYYAAYKYCMRQIDRRREIAHAALEAPKEQA